MDPELAQWVLTTFSANWGGGREVNLCLGVQSSGQGPGPGMNDTSMSVSSHLIPTACLHFAREGRRQKNSRE